MIRKRVPKLVPLMTLLLVTVLCPAQTNYFPSGTFGDDQFRVNWYSKALKSLREPSLYEPERIEGTQSYRFLWLRSFHHPVSVRLDIKADGTALLTTRITSGAGGYDPGKLIQNRTRTISKERTDWFLNRIDESNFWKLPTVEKMDAEGLDGAQWIIEGTKKGKYHVVDRWSPDKGEVRSIGLMMLLDFAKLKLLYLEVY
jgi:hypothetical protein